MMDILIWVIIIGLFILSFIGVIFPIIPSSLVIWVGFLLYHFVINGDTLRTTFWIVMGIFTAVLIISDIVANSYFVKRFGGSKLGERGAGIAVIVGSFIIPPFGILILPPLTVLVIEMIQKRTLKEALLASTGSFIGFMSGAVAKIIIQLVMIIWFIIVVVF